MQVNLALYNRYHPQQTYPVPVKEHKAITNLHQSWTLLTQYTSLLCTFHALQWLVKYKTEMQPDLTSLI
jgi:hypothetical protein